ncbi:hypothetical protein Daura_26845 [Dactylosporangium aurantiacum]|uniref:Lipoprotein n=1 Tax=Dactylosporangium aurantiacum TaxID=35754 RepID=A0A9Q9IAJ6_9ACTN|nr:hypothetical protein [Dactylosporangium aurantiacum]MDG6106518.1 hypothetical protein [Dactylosporangium aurantiacum]UWZ50452.1 hypothetical protein Daura_26845 [Dactylosporangium aurantiacum]
MHAPARTAAALLAALLTGGLLAACSPPEEPMMAVGRDGSGRPVLHLRQCGDAGTVARVSLTLGGPEAEPAGTAMPTAHEGLQPSGAAPSGSATAVPYNGRGLPATPAGGGPLWRIWNAADTDRSWTIEIGTTPAGWREEPDPSVPAGPVQLLPERRYRLYAFTYRPHVRDVVFTLADLDRLGDGQVWGHKGHGGEARPLTLEQFREQADDAC